MQRFEEIKYYIIIIIIIIITYWSSRLWLYVVYFCVAGLPPTGSWQDLKDHMREAGDVCFADVYKDGTGVVEFLKYEDMKYAARKLDDSKFRSHEVSKTNSVRIVVIV